MNKIVSKYHEGLAWDALKEGYSSHVYVCEGLPEVDNVVESRAFTRWYSKNAKLIHRMAVLAPAVAFTLGGISPEVLSYILNQDMATLAVSSVISASPPYPTMGPMILTGGVTASFAETHGLILIHMLIIGFLTLVVSTFLRFTGRGDIVPLIAFVGGGSILYEVIGMFSDIYLAVVNFLKI